MSLRALGWTALCISILASAAAAAPDPTQCTVPPVIVGDSNGSMIGIGYRVVVRDNFGDPVPLSHVLLAYGAGTAKAYTAQVSPATSLCPAISKTTTTVGIVVFTPRAGGYCNTNQISVVADGILIGDVLARSTDIDCDGTTSLNDLNLFRNNYLLHPTNPETDYDQSGTTNVADLNIFRQVYVADITGTPCF